MDDQYSYFSLKALESDLATKEAEIDQLIDLHSRVSNKLDLTVFYLELLRHEISIRKLNRQRWNGKRLAMTIE